MTVFRGFTQIPLPPPKNSSNIPKPASLDLMFFNRKLEPSEKLKKKEL